jgi:exodeoxyribonuclease-1
MGDGDKRVFPEVRATPPQALGMKAFGFRDARLPELLFRYRARNWPDTLSMSERARWNDYRRLRLRDERGLSEYSFESFRAEIAALRTAHAGDGGKQVLLDQLDTWGLEVEASLA